MNITLGLAALYLLSGPVLAQESASPTDRLNQLFEQVQAVSDSAVAKGTNAPLSLAPKDAKKSSDGSDAVVVLPLVKPLPTGTAPSKKQDLDTLSVVTNQVSPSGSMIEQKEKELRIEKERAAEETNKKQDLLGKIEKAKQILAENQARQREIINNEIENSLSTEGQNLDSIVGILKDRVFVYSVWVYSIADDKTQSKLLTQGTVVTTLGQVGIFTQFDQISSAAVNSKDVKKDKAGPNLYISAYPILTDSAKIRSNVSITGSQWDTPLSSRQKFFETSVSHKSNFVSKVTDLMSEKGDVHRIISDKYEIVISAVLD